MAPLKQIQFFEELSKLTVEELKIISDYPFTDKTVDISHLEALVDTRGFDYWFKLYLPTMLFNHIDKLNKVK